MNYDYEINMFLLIKRENIIKSKLSFDQGNNNVL